MSIVKNVGNLYFNWKSVKTDAKLLVIESDDWGSIRMSSKENRDALEKHGHAIRSNPYQMFDGLETDMDMQVLGDTLESYENSKGAHQIFTLNNSTANPDFKKIEEGDYSRFYREPFNQTYLQYGDSDM